ncbi:hypothetical protein DFR58_11623 [Anaerobacterium chartisolvens]|uniref:DUF7305 domain-containing protein n=1 Tax=Anaerobacterium chartisolvens TaxID=1297424 RepID=A0A369B258_9FIRM|nr:pilus assembly PilX N-terminal domain-containing protein [Anaerobacterium chartisolvens]RCX13794.1 hypothetical protein DFR58_11623 [Anaerobacterium chartisolvens]
MTVNLKSSQRGSAMIVTLMVVMVLTFLGTTLWFYSVNDVMRADRQVKRTQAYYIARSGCEAVSDYIIKTRDTSMVEGEGEDRQSDSIPLEKGSFSVRVREEPSGEVVITSTGTVDDVSDRAILTLVKKLEVRSAFKNALFAKEDLYFREKVDILGDIETNANIYYGNEFDYDGFDESYDAMAGSTATFTSRLEFPNSSSNLDYTIKEGDRYIISASEGEKEFKWLTVEEGGILEIDLSEGDVNISVSAILTVDGRIVITGDPTGRKVNLFVQNLFATGNINCKADDEEDDDYEDVAPNHLILYIDRGKLQPSGDGSSGKKMSFKGCIYGPEASILLKSIEYFEGSMIARIIDNTEATGAVIKYSSGDGTTESDVNFGVTQEDIKYKKGLWRR